MLKVIYAGVKVVAGLRMSSLEHQYARKRVHMHAHRYAQTNG